MKTLRACALLCLLNFAMLAFAGQMDGSFESEIPETLGPPLDRAIVPMGADPAQLHLLRRESQDGLAAEGPGAMTFDCARTNQPRTTRECGRGCPGAGWMQNYSLCPGFFVGLGGSYNSVRLAQHINASGVSNVYSGSTLVAYGQAGGPANPFHSTQSTFAPTAQLGFFRNRPSSNWLWGAKFSYRYLGTTFTDQNVNSPQTGAFTNTTGAPSNTSFTGHVIIGSAQTAVNHELAFMPFLGRSFENSYVYLGAGPAVFGTRSQLYQATGFADINGTHFDITGTPVNFSNSNWMWGGAAQIGMAYSLTASLFLDVSYDFIITGGYTNNNSAPFASSAAGYTDSGTLYVNATQRVIAQSFTVSFNKAF